MHLAMHMDMYFETLSILILLLTNFAVTIFASNHAYTLLSRYEYFYIAITIMNFISMYQYIAHTTTLVLNSPLSLCSEINHDQGISAERDSVLAM